MTTSTDASATPPTDASVPTPDARPEPRLSAPGLRLVAVGLIEHGSRDGVPTYVVTRRRQHDHLGGHWELPGGRVEPAESPEEALRRELAEELGIGIEPPEPLTFSYHRYPEREVLLLFFEARSAPGSQPLPLAAESLALLTLDELVALPMPPANAPLIQHLIFKQSRS